MVCYNPQEIIRQYQAGEWPDNPAFQEVYRGIWQKQKQAVKLAERMRALPIEGNPDTRIIIPDLKRELAILQEEHSKALYDCVKCGGAYGKHYAAAVKAVKKGGPEWYFTLVDQILLGIIHLHANLQQSDFNDLRPMIEEWQKENGPKSATDNKQWGRAIKASRVVKLLGAIKKTAVR
jgi:hypothetical protein